MLYSLIMKLNGNTIAGWTFLSISIWFIGGLQMISIGVIGEYVGKIYTLTAEVKNGEGRLPLGDSVWGIQGEDLPAGSKIKITKVSGNTLNFEKVA